MERNYYAIIPANVRYSEKISANAKLLYGELTALTNEKGYCWASNSYFAELYKVHKQTISEWIRQLSDANFISVTIRYKEGSLAIDERRISIITEDELDRQNNEKGFPTYRQKDEGGIGKKTKGVSAEMPIPMGKKTKDNNTLNNTLNNTSNIEGLVFPFSSEKFLKEWSILIQEPKWKRKTKTALQSALIKLSKFTEEESIEAINDAINGNYQGIFPKSKNKFQKNETRTNPFIDQLRSNASR